MTERAIYYQTSCFYRFSDVLYVKFVIFRGGGNSTFKNYAYNEKREK